MEQTIQPTGGNLWSRALKPWCKRALRRYLMDAMGAMVYGLFASLLIGTILKTFFGFLPESFLTPYFAQITYWTGAASPLVGAAIGVSVAAGLKSKPLAIYTSAVVGGIAYMMNGIDPATGEKIAGAITAGPAGAVVAVIIAAELGSLVTDKTPFNLLVVPAVSLLSGTAAALLIGPPIAGFMQGLGQMVMSATTLYPLPMGILVALLVGLSLTAPISSAALCVMLNLSGLAAGAATAGCCAQMIGFAVASFRENRWSGLLAQGVGTSKIQFPNVVAHPQILIPATLASGIGGALATTVFGMTNSPLGAGMGTCGLVGPILGFKDMVEVGGDQALPVLLSIALLYFIIPAVLALTISEFMRRKGWLKGGEMKLSKEV